MRLLLAEHCNLDRGGHIGVQRDLQRGDEVTIRTRLVQATARVRRVAMLWSRSASCLTSSVMAQPEF